MDKWRGRAWQSAEGAAFVLPGMSRHPTKPRPRRPRHPRPKPLAGYTFAQSALANICAREIVQRIYWQPKKNNTSRVFAIGFKFKNNGTTKRREWTRLNACQV